MVSPANEQPRTHLDDVFSSMHNDLVQHLLVHFEKAYRELTERFSNYLEETRVFKTHFGLGSTPDVAAIEPFAVTSAHVKQMLDTPGRVDAFMVRIDEITAHCTQESARQKASPFPTTRDEVRLMVHQTEAGLEEHRCLIVALQQLVLCAD